MRVLISGASGLLGRAVLEALRVCQIQAVVLVREQSPPSDCSVVRWNPERGEIQLSATEHFDAVIHLSGANLAQGRWTAARKAVIWRSRIDSTRLLTESLARLATPPAVMLSASAVGFYGDRGADYLDEQSLRGTGFLADLCGAWEQASARLPNAGVRVVNMRLGVILSREAGALRQMLPIFRLGLGGRLGSGTQFWSWITIDDAVSAVLHAMDCPLLSGPVNFVAPHPVTNREFSRVLAASLARPAFLAVPTFAARLAFGEMADEALLSSQRVAPRKLIASGFAFQFPDIQGALRRILSSGP